MEGVPLILTNHDPRALEEGLPGVERSVLDPWALYPVCSPLPFPNLRCWCPYLLGSGPNGFARDFLLPFPCPDLSSQLQVHRIHHLPEVPTQMSNMRLAPNTARRTRDFSSSFSATSLRCPKPCQPLSSPSPKPLVTLDPSLPRTGLPDPRKFGKPHYNHLSSQSFSLCLYYVLLLRLSRRGPSSGVTGCHLVPHSKRELESSFIRSLHCHA